MGYSESMVPVGSKQEAYSVFKAMRAFDLDGFFVKPLGLYVAAEALGSEEASYPEGQIFAVFGGDEFPYQTLHPVSIVFRGDLMQYGRYAPLLPEDEKAVQAAVADRKMLLTLEFIKDNLYGGLALRARYHDDHASISKAVGAEVDRMMGRTDRSWADQADREGKEAEMAEKQVEGTGGYVNALINVPVKITATQESVYRLPKSSAKGEPLVSVTLPEGTMVDGRSVAYYKLVIPESNLDPYGQRYPDSHTLRFPRSDARTGEPWMIRLTPPGHRDASGNWVADGEPISLSTGEFEAVMDGQKQNRAAYLRMQRENGGLEDPGKQGAGLDDLDEMRTDASYPGSDAPKARPAHEPGLG